MKAKLRGILDIFIGVILFSGVLIGGTNWVSSFASRYPSMGWVSIGAVVASLIIGLLSGMLLLAGYLRMTNSEEGKQ